MSLSGNLLIGQRAIAGTQAPVFAINPATNAQLEPAYPGGSREHVELACSLAWEAFDRYRDTSLEARAAFLERIAQNIEALGDTLVQRGTNHSWSNRSDESAFLAFVLIDAMLAGIDAAV